MSLQCLAQKTRHKCPFSHIKEEQSAIEALYIASRRMSTLQEELEKKLKEASLKELFKVEAIYLDGYALDLKEESINPVRIHEESTVQVSKECELTPSTCQYALELKKEVKKNIRMQLSNQISWYNDRVHLIQKLKAHYKEQVDTSFKSTSFLFLKHIEDNEGVPVFIHFNMKPFLTQNKAYDIGNLYLFYGEDYSPYKDCSVIQFRQLKESCGIVYIEKLHTSYPDKNHAILLLTSLKKLMVIINTLFNRPPLTQIYCDGHLKSNLPRYHLRKNFLASGYDVLNQSYEDGTYIGAIGFKYTLNK